MSRVTRINEACHTYECIMHVNEPQWHLMQCVAVCCSVLQCVAVCCSVLQCVAVWCSVKRSVLQCVAINASNATERVAMYRSLIYVKYEWLPSISRDVTNILYQWVMSLQRDVTQNVISFSHVPLHSPSSNMWQHLPCPRALFQKKLWLNESHSSLNESRSSQYIYICIYIYIYIWMSLVPVRVVIGGNISRVHERIQSQNDIWMSHIPLGLFLYKWVISLSTFRVFIHGNISLVHVRIPI